MAAVWMEPGNPGLYHPYRANQVLQCSFTKHCRKAYLGKNRQKPGKTSCTEMYYDAVIIRDQ